MNSEFKEKIHDKTFRVGVIGLGYVGIPLSLGFARNGITVTGFDIDEKKIKLLSNGESYLEHIPSKDIAECVKSGHLEATASFDRIGDVDGIILCVPTPLDNHLEPDLSFVESTLKQIVPYLRKGQIISLESTTYPEPQQK